MYIYTPVFLVFWGEIFKIKFWGARLIDPPIWFLKIAVNKSFNYTILIILSPSFVLEHRILRLG